MRRTSQPSVADLQKRVRELELALFKVRFALLDMVRDEGLADVLRARSHCDTPADLSEWQAWAVRHCIAAATPGSADEMGGLGPRAYCPLCRDGASLQYHAGFSLPVGLERHLLGTHSAHRCSVFATAYAMAQDRLTEERDERLQFGRPDEPQTPPWRQPEKQPPPYLARPRSARLLRQDSEGRRPASVIDLVLGRPPRDL
jgi:hypothetical protein